MSKEQLQKLNVWKELADDVEELHASLKCDNWSIVLKQVLKQDNASLRPEGNSLKQLTKGLQEEDAKMARFEEARDTI